MKIILLSAIAAVAHAGYAPDSFKAGVHDADFQGVNFGVAEAMQLHMMPEKATQDGAVCLDGTAAGFYYSNATAAADSKSWEIYFQGGGWCYDKEDCWGRSSTGLGSSKSWAPTSSIGGIMSSDCTSNPDFCN